MNDSVDNKHLKIPRKCIIINCSQTRYHVVRAAAVSLGWYVENEEREDIPSSFYNVKLSKEISTLKEEISFYGIKYNPITSPQILWLDKSILSSRVSALSCYHRINHFPGMNIIARKAVLFKRLMRIRRRADLSLNLSEMLNSFPWSFSSLTEQLQLERFLIEYQNKEKNQNLYNEIFFILKPNKGCQGKGIILTPEPLQVIEKLKTETNDDYLVQLYITPPLCIERKKFDLRIYVLLTSIVPGKPPKRRLRPSLAELKGNNDQNDINKNSSHSSILDGLNLFVHHEGLVRICAEEYAFPSRINCDKPSVHLTNYAVNKTVKGFTVGEVKEEYESNFDKKISNSDSEGLYEGNKRDFKFLENYINSFSSENNLNTEFKKDEVLTTPWERVLRRIDMCIMLTILSGWEELQREFIGTGASRGSRSDGLNCFELLGFDMMLTEKLEPILMEVNHSPSLFCDSNFDFITKRRVVMDTLKLLEPYIPSIEKCNDASYALHQMNLSKNSNNIVNGFRKIAPQRNENDEWDTIEMGIFEEMLHHTRRK